MALSPHPDDFPLPPPNDATPTLPSPPPNDAARCSPPPNDDNDDARFALPPPLLHTHPQHSDNLSLRTPAYYGARGRDSHEPTFLRDNSTFPTHHPRNRELWISELHRLEGEMFKEHSVINTQKINEHFIPPIHSTPISIGFFKGLEALKLHPECDTCLCMSTSYERINFAITRSHFKCWTCECDNLFAIGSVKYRPSQVGSTGGVSQSIGTLSQIRTKLFQ